MNFLCSVFLCWYWCITKILNKVLVTFLGGSDITKQASNMESPSNQSLSFTKLSEKSHDTLNLSTVHKNLMKTSLQSLKVSFVLCIIFVICMIAATFSKFSYWSIECFSIENSLFSLTSQVAETGRTFSLLFHGNWPHYFWKSEIKYLM